jgi:sialic acid synthase
MFISKKNFSKNSIFIAEVGQNHQGSLSMAKKYVREFSKLGANIIKFQTRNNKFLFSKKAYNKQYDSENAFGKTYGQHREKLELSYSELKILKKECEKNNVKFMSTPFEEKSLKLLLKLKIDIIKISSFDIGNLSFIEKIAKTKKPIVISIGGAKIKHIDESIKMIRKYHSKMILMHCVSQYPCPLENLDLTNITKLKKRYPDLIIGSSDHFNGILSGPIAYILGARVFEKHVTFDRSLKGTDHKFSLEPEGFRKFVRDVKRSHTMLNSKKSKSVGKEPVFLKLGKSVTARNKIFKGQKIKLTDLTGTIFEKNYIPIRDTYKVLNKKAKDDIDKDEAISFNQLK